VDVSLLIRHRLNELGLEQKDLASAAQVTESYISQLLGRKKAPPASGRTDLYDKIGDFLRLPKGELAKLADLQRREEMKKKIAEPPGPLFEECRKLILRKCVRDKRKEIQEVFQKQPFGELERLVSQKLLDVTQGFAREDLRSEEWLRQMAEFSDRSYEQMRVAILEFLDADVFSISLENCVSFLDPMIDSWDIDLKTFSLEIVLSRRLARARTKRFEFVEKEPDSLDVVEPGLEQFLNDPSLSGDVTEEEVQFLTKLHFNGRRPTPLYYYRELQNLRDPIHFQAPLQQTLSD
jgi:transcriptional regulator with XRE-family HTH domain